MNVSFVSLFCIYMHIAILKILHIYIYIYIYLAILTKFNKFCDTNSIHYIVQQSPLSIPKIFHYFNKNSGVNKQKIETASQNNMLFLHGYHAKILL